MLHCELLSFLTVIEPIWLGCTVSHLSQYKPWMKGSAVPGVTVNVSQIIAWRAPTKCCVFSLRSDMSRSLQALIMKERLSSVHKNFVSNFILTLLSLPNMEDESWSATVNTGVNVVVIKDFSASPSAIMLRRRYPNTVFCIIITNIGIRWWIRRSKVFANAFAWGACTSDLLHELHERWSCIRSTSRGFDSISLNRAHLLHIQMIYDVRAGNSQYYKQLT